MDTRQFYMQNTPTENVYGGSVNQILDNIAMPGPMYNISNDVMGYSTWMGTGYITKRFLKQIIRLNDSYDMSMGDALNVCLKLGLIDNGSSDLLLADVFNKAFSDIVSTLNNCRSDMVRITECVQIVQNLCGFEVMCNVMNAIACGGVIVGYVTIDGNAKLRFSFETGLPPLYTTADVDSFRAYNQ